MTRPENPQPPEKPSDSAAAVGKDHADYQATYERLEFVYSPRNYHQTPLYTVLKVQMDHIVALTFAVKRLENSVTLLSEALGIKDMDDEELAAFILKIKGLQDGN